MAGSRIAGITIEIGGDTTKLQDALKGVNTQIRDTQNNLKDVERLLKLDPSHTELLAQKQSLLKEKIGETKEKLDTLKTAQEQAKQQLESGDLGKDKYDDLQREIIATEEELKKLAREAADANEALNKIDSAGQKLESLGGKISSVGQTLTTGLTLPLVGIGTAGAKSFAEVDKTMQLANKTMGNTEEQAQLLNVAMKEAAANSTFGMSDAATAVLNFARAGLDAEQAAAALAPAMNLAAGEGGNLDTVSGGLVATINGFHGSFEDAGHYADVFASACNNSALDVDSLSHAMSVAAPIFSAAGYSVEDAALYMGVMANNGIDADKAANSLKTGLARLVSPAKEGAEMMDKLGISVTNSDGTMKSSIQIQKELHEAFGKLSESEQIAAASAIFGKNQMAPWLALINTAPEDVGSLDESLRTCAGTTDEMAEAMMSGFGGSLEKLKSSIDVLVTSIGEALAPTIQKVTDFIQKLVDKFNALTPAQQQTIVKIGMLVAALGPALMVIGKLTTGVGKGLQAISKMGKGILTFVNEAKLGVGAGGKFVTALTSINPVTVGVVAGVAAVGAAFVNLWQNNEGFRNKMISIWESLKAKFAEFGQKIVDILNSVGFDFKDMGEVINTVLEGIKTAWDAFCNLLAPVFEAAFQILSTTIGAVLDVIAGIFQTFAGLFSGDWDMFWDGISSIFEGIVNGWVGIVDAVLEAIKGIVDVFLGWFGTDWETVWNGVSTFFSGIWEGITTTVSTATQAIATGISSAWSTVQGLFSSAWNAIASTVSSAWNNITSTVGSAVESVKTKVTSAWQSIQTTVTNTLNTLKTNVVNTWNNIKSSITTTLNNIKTSATNTWNNIKSSISSTVENIKSTVTQKWNNIKTSVSTAVENIKSTITQKWDAIKSTLSTTVENIKTTVTQKWNAMKTSISTTADSIKTAVSQKWDSIKTSLTTAMTTIATNMSQKWNNIKSTLTPIVDSIKTKITGAFDGIKTSISTAMENVKTKLKSAWDGAVGMVRDAVQKLKSLLNFSWSLPKLKLPHFKITGKFSLNPPQVPHFGVEWYKKAMDNAMLLSGPTIFGAAGGKLLGGGEAGTEVVAGADKLMAMIKSSIADVLATSHNMVSSMTSTMGGGSAAASDNTGDTIIAMLSRYLPYLPEVANMKMVTDTGALVGQLAPEMNKQLGVISQRQRRQ